MPLLSITRLRLSRFRYLPGFFRLSGPAAEQLKASNGAMAAYLARSWPLAFWTVSLWRDEECMRAYRASGAHLTAMPFLLDWCDEAAVATIRDYPGSIPTPRQATALLLEHGRLSKLRHPSAAQQSAEIWPDSRVPITAQSIVSSR